ncbi:M24 family metallopeptidase [Halalkalicoccus jeotgali]|uniref:Xaa-Pro aminopeptidase, M24 family protein n=1 Tax=Halalkalicoccus jeotgali (strain DSM 18796 / CECT 7217 / JCM 14584 / KCTC 4019 / B3) TaxID=795797 RepID=D8JAK2_HALJB|nr:M24 family metallopeptidase [Halalkalicoccus jeotgali]ADJ14724.1 Xaa-Pro aminopeptidase, M24 family protein [Halalkalicoccus jeotgali B3]ELY39306.1 Xaa-Pro aminopeptidase, M24 family protein [Halalkalicoccus jeotgali B3]
MKRTRLDAYRMRHDLDSIWLARPENFAWLTGGTNVVDRAGDLGVAAAGYDGHEVTVITDNIEAARLAEEELSDERIVTYDWYSGSLADAVASYTDGRAAADFRVPGFRHVDISALRYPLTDGDIETYRELGRETAEVLEGVCRELEPTSTEREVAADLRGELAEQGIDSPVALVGGAKRAREYRHYTPTTKKLGKYALVSVTARRDGLHASCTRTVAFDAPEWLESRHEAATKVETAALAATRQVGRTGGKAREVFEAIQEAYREVSYPREWKHHHQGGAAGYQGREWIATPWHDGEVTLPMAYAWNPTVQGAKSEDTVLVREDEPEVLTTTGEWPTRSVSKGGLELERPAVLELD